MGSDITWLDQLPQGVDTDHVKVFFAVGSAELLAIELLLCLVGEQDLPHFGNHAEAAARAFGLHLVADHLLHFAVADDLQHLLPDEYLIVFKVDVAPRQPKRLAMKIAVILTAYYGLRRSEVLGLKWDAIDPVEDKIYIRHKIIENKLNGNEIEGLDVMKTKSSYRSLPLMPFIKKALEEERTRQEEMQRVLRKSYNRKYLDYVCVDAMGDILKPQYVTEHFKVILERNGLKKIRFHDLRHSCASLMLANDISMKEIQEWLGHSNISTTANIYAHVDSESKRESARIIDKVLSTEEAV